MMRGYVFSFAVSMLALLLGACGSPIIGAECRTGFSACNGQCVNTSVDFNNCGMCGNDCGAFLCTDGVCTTVPIDAGTADGGGRDASVDAGVDAGPNDGGFDPDPNLGGCRIGEIACDGICSKPSTDRLNCGECGIVCAGNEVCSRGVCDAVCAPDLLACNDLCLDGSADPRHCGRCEGQCVSGTCVDGSCADGISGYAIVVGHDCKVFSASVNRLVAAAVFTGRGNPIRVLEYAGDGDAKSITNIRAALDGAEAATGRRWKRIDAIESIVPLQLADADVMLIHAQAGARKTTIAKLGKQWGNALAQFVAGGHVIVLFESPSTINDGTFRVLEPAKIFSAAERSTVPPNEKLDVPGVGFGAAMNLPSRYPAVTNTSRFTGVTTPGLILVEDSTGAPVVIERVITPSLP